MGSETRVFDIVVRFLDENSARYDGLVQSDGVCACLSDDLAPCGEMSDSCRAGHRVDLAAPNDDCQDCGEGPHWHIVGGPRPLPAPPPPEREDAKCKCGHLMELDFSHRLNCPLNPLRAEAIKDEMRPAPPAEGARHPGHYADCKYNSYPCPNPDCNPLPPAEGACEGKGHDFVPIGEGENVCGVRDADGFTCLCSASAHRAAKEK